MTPADEGTTPPEREYDKLVPFLDFDREVSSESVQYNGWLKDSSIDLRWSEQGQIVLEISNGYSTTWTIRERYVGNPHATVTTNSNGLITLQVRDEDGVREYEIRNGGLGPIFRRWIRETEVSGDPA